MNGHSLILQEMVVRASEPARQLEFERRRMVHEAKEARAAQLGTVTWFGGLKATASFLRDSLRGVMVNRTMTEVRG